MTAPPLAGLVLTARGVTVAYGERPIVHDLDLAVGPGETVALLGPSGSGKTTFLYAVAGFLPLAAGEIWLGTERVAGAGSDLPPERRSVGMVFQHYGLWPHLDAQDSVAYPMRRAGMDAATSRRAARELLAGAGIDHLAKRRPSELSGGEQQRVGLARALARRPALFLLDEPTAHLDAVSKGILQAELTGRLEGHEAAAILATHDVEEAFSVADRIFLLREGRVVQSAEPATVYAQPVDEWAARMTGIASFIDGAVDVLEGEGQGRCLVRPDWVVLGGPIAATVVGVGYRGSHTDYRLATGLGQIVCRVPGPPALVRGDRTSCRVERAWRMPAAPPG